MLRSKDGYGGGKMGRGIRVFLKRNKIQLLIALVCIIITIKQMDTDFLFKYNYLTEILFKKLPADHFFSETFELISDLSFA